MPNPWHTIARLLEQAAQELRSIPYAEPEHAGWVPPHAEAGCWVTPKQFCAAYPAWTPAALSEITAARHGNGLDADGIVIQQRGSRKLLVDAPRLLAWLTQQRDPAPRPRLVKGGTYGRTH